MIKQDPPYRKSSKINVVVEKCKKRLNNGK